MDTKNGSNYQSIGGGAGSPSAASTPIVFCIHGNKFGVARCCEDLSPDHIHPDHEGPTSFAGNLDTPSNPDDVTNSTGGNF